jgi:hypothetical protein
LSAKHLKDWQITLHLRGMASRRQEKLRTDRAAMVLLRGNAAATFFFTRVIDAAIVGHCRIYWKFGGPDLQIS